MNTARTICLRILFRKCNISQFNSIYVVVCASLLVLRDSVLNLLLSQPLSRRAVSTIYIYLTMGIKCDILNDVENNLLDNLDISYDNECITVPR